jgi:hypothetical protein
MNIVYCETETITQIWPPETGLYVHTLIYFEAAECAAAAAVTAAGASLAKQIPYAGAIVSAVIGSYAADIAAKNQGYGVDVELRLPLLALSGFAYFVHISSHAPYDAVAFYEGNFIGMRAIESHKPLQGGPTADGWMRLAVDLNMGAGGEYIYFEIQPPPSAFTSQQLSTYVAQAKPPSMKQVLLTQDKQTLAGQGLNWWHDAMIAHAPANRICALDVEVGNTANLPPPAGYNQIPLDLNKGAGGMYIYASFKVGVPPLNGVAVVAGSTQSTSAPTGFTRINVDLNKGAGGRYIYLCYK